MPSIDARLLDCYSIPELIENYNRILTLVDAQATTIASMQEDITALDARVTALETPGV